MSNLPIILTKTVKEDLYSFFKFQQNKEASYLAAFTSKDMNDEVAYIERYTNYLNDITINMRTIKVNDVIAGSIAKFVVESDTEITYLIDKHFWGQGIATMALSNF